MDAPALPGAGLKPFPGFDAAFHNPEEGMRGWRDHCCNSPAIASIPECQLPKQVFQFVLQLAFCHGDPSYTRKRPDFSTVKGIPAAFRFKPDAIEIATDTGAGMALRPESVELWMMTVTPGPTLEYVFRKKAFSPEGDEARRV